MKQIIITCDICKKLTDVYLEIKEGTLRRYTRINKPEPDNKIMGVEDVEIKDKIVCSEYCFMGLIENVIKPKYLGSDKSLPHTNATPIFGGIK